MNSSLCSLVLISFGGSASLPEDLLELFESADPAGGDLRPAGAIAFKHTVPRVVSRRQLGSARHVTAQSNSELSYADAQAACTGL